MFKSSQTCLTLSGNINAFRNNNSLDRRKQNEGQSKIDQANDRLSPRPTQSRSTATVLAVAASFSTQANEPTTRNKIKDNAQDSGYRSSTIKHKQDPATGILCQTGFIIIISQTNL